MHTHARTVRKSFAIRVSTGLEVMLNRENTHPSACRSSTYSILDIYEASTNGCVLFGTLFVHGGAHVIDPRQRNLATIKNPLERFIAKWGQGEFHISFRTEKNGFDDVQNVPFHWLHRNVTGVDERYSCRVPKPQPGTWNICALGGTNAGKWVKNRPVNLAVGSTASLEAAKRCLMECHSSHQGCGRDQSVIPSRLLKLGTDNDTIKIIDTNGKPLKHLVSQYTNRDLTVSTDKLVAIAGIADEFANFVKIQYPDKSAQYTAGLWHFDIPRQLLWKRYIWDSRPLSLRPGTYRAPSWSWASIDDSITFQEHCQPLVEVLGDHVTLKNEELPYGEVTFALLAVVARINRPLVAHCHWYLRIVIGPMSSALKTKSLKATH
ncbi:hypothetical protein P280DRAFT_532134 [Massarina eburnea CBS 473.64]|uniref:Heterokaryon incompatibility domain-containing protein n=1 Tax=Massarina eburnea CBS 473.64 TaxID=1395130 RepID=A0A6A6SD56_9PLEO|nr:hypothetical protein P280DRAFT_532134 [Massarina eburnea CBS 473.64]